MLLTFERLCSDAMFPRESRDEADISGAVRRTGRRLNTRRLDACCDKGSNFPAQIISDWRRRLNLMLFEFRFWFYNIYILLYLSAWDCSSG